jgi:hypothetical protein
MAHALVEVSRDVAYGDWAGDSFRVKRLRGSSADAAPDSSTTSTEGMNAMAKPPSLEAFYSGSSYAS